MELQDLLDKEGSDDELVSFVNGLVGDRESLELREEISGDGSVWVLKNSGLQISLDKNRKVNTIHVFSDAASGYSNYPNELPMGLTVETSREAANTLLGNPIASGGPVDSVTDNSVFYWDRWDWERFSLHLIYPEDKKSINALAIIRPDTVPS